MSLQLSIEIRPEKIVLVEGQVNKGIITVNHVLQTEIPKGTIVESEIANTTVVLEALQRMIRESGIKTKKATTTLDIGNMLLRDFEVPDGKQDEVMGMVKSEMVQNYAAATSDVVQFKKIGEVTEDGRKRIRVRATSISSHIVEQYYEILKQLKLKPIAMDSNANAMEKLIKGNTEINGLSLKDSDALLIDFGVQGATLHAIHQGEVQISRFTALGTEDMNDYISGKMNQFGERGDYLKNLNLHDQTGSDVISHAQAFLIQWCNEIQKVVKFIQLRLDTINFDNVYLMGEATEIEGIEELLSEHLFLPVEILRSVSPIHFKSENESNQITYCLNAAAAMIRM